MDKCVFCEILKGSIPSFIIYEDEDFLAFLDISQFTKGHTVVIPKKHVQFVWDFDQVGKYFEVVSKIANHFRALGYKYVDSITFGRKVPHAHVHLIPHNGDSVDYQKAISVFGEMQKDQSRRSSKDVMSSIQNELEIKK